MKISFYRGFLKTSAGKITAVIILCVLPMNIFMIINSHFQFQNAASLVKLSLQNTANTHMNTLDGYTRNADTMIYELINNDPIFVKLRITEDDTVYANTRVQCFWRMHDLTALHSIGDGLFVYHFERDDILLTTTTAYDKERAQLARLIKQECFSSTELQWHIIEMNQQKWAFRVSKYKHIYYGALINLDTFMEEIRSAIPYKSTYIIFTSELLDEPKGFLQVSAASTRTPLLLDIRIHEDEFATSFIPTQLFNITLIILFLGIIPLLTLYTHKLFAHPIRELNHAHYQLQIGHDSYRINKRVSSLDLQSTFDSFNKMADNIKALQDKNLEKELAQKQMELDNLQLQIRPHFLHNIFNLIYLLCEDKNLEGIRRIIIYLSEYFRVIYQTQQAMISFDRELELIHGYIYATSIRYPNMIQINYQIDPEISSILIPPLLIHNFIENIVKHAIIPQKVVHITLAAIYDDDAITFQISDDGRGMSQEAVARINRYGTDNENGTPYDGHVGLRNSVQRLKHFYGEKASLYVESELGQGTVFVITLPNIIETEESL